MRLEKEPMLRLVRLKVAAEVVEKSHKKLADADAEIQMRRTALASTSLAGGKACIVMEVDK